MSTNRVNKPNISRILPVCEASGVQSESEHVPCQERGEEFLVDCRPTGSDPETGLEEMSSNATSRTTSRLVPRKTTDAIQCPPSCGPKLELPTSFTRVRVSVQGSMVRFRF